MRFRLPRYVPIVTEVLGAVREFVERSIVNDEPVVETFLNLTVPYRQRALYAEAEVERLEDAIENDAPEGTEFFRMFEDESGNRHLGYMLTPFASVSHPVIVPDLSDPTVCSVYHYVFDEDSERVEYQHIGYFMTELPE